MVDGLGPETVQGCCCPRPRAQGPGGVSITSQSTTPCSSWQQQPLGTTKPRYLEQQGAPPAGPGHRFCPGAKAAGQSHRITGGRAGQGWEETLLTRTRHFRHSGETSLSQLSWVPLPGKRNLFSNKASEQASLPAWNQNSPEGWVSLPESGGLNADSSPFCDPQHLPWVTGYQ